MRQGIIRLIVLFMLSPTLMAAESAVKLDKAPIDLSDAASLQRGAQVYMNNCLGCHGLRYTRYDSMAKGIRITDEAGDLLGGVVKKNLLFTGDKLSDPIKTALLREDAENWFGTAPPDLTLVARVRGVDWLYTYMRTFYVDPDKPWGVNNLTFPDVGMPHVLVGLQGVQAPVYDTVEQTSEDGTKVKVETIKGLKLVEGGTLKPAEYDSLVADLVNFLSYVGEPVQLERKRLGAWVLMFLSIFLVFSYLLKREYWKDVH